MMRVKVWDPFVRVFHWSVVLLFFANLAVLDEESWAHAYAGYALFGLLVLRLVWGIVGSKTARFSTFWPRVSTLRRHVAGYLQGETTQHLSHNPIGAVMVVNLLVTLLLICGSGILMTDGGLSHSELLKDTHEVLVGYACVCVCLHLFGVGAEGRRSGVNLISAMVTGWKRFPKEPSDAT